MKKSIVFSYLAVALFVLSACSGGSFKADHHYEIEPFEFTNQNNESVSLKDLQGQVWLSQFVFTKCTSACPPMMVNMAELQDKLVAEGIEDYKIVSFSIDPEIDTPEALQAYMGLYNIPDTSKWEMLTGYSQETIADIAAKSFKTMVIDDPTTDQVAHGTAFALVNQKGEVVKSYNGFKDVPYDKIAKDMKALIKEG